MMLGIFNLTKRDTEVFKRAITKTGQVSIAIREVNIEKIWAGYMVLLAGLQNRLDGEIRNSPIY